MTDYLLALHSNEVRKGEPQTKYEVAYKGYRRVLVQMDDEMTNKSDIQFPVVEEGSAIVFYVSASQGAFIVHAWPLVEPVAATHGDTVSFRVRALKTEPRDWKDLSTAPRNGSKFDVLCETADGGHHVCKDLLYGQPLMGRHDELILRGTQNKLSSYFTPLKWDYSR